MSDTIDKRIVEMSFENDKFEKGVGNSLNTIDKLKKGLNFENAAKGFAGITAAAHGVNLGSIADGVNHIASRFSAMGVIAITTLVNMTNAAIQAGTRIVKALTVDPIKMGLDEYETLMGSIQTVLANTSSKGTTLDQVNEALDQLNEYSDKTIYNFQQMARNIGTFTAAGIDLDTAVSAIKGIANLAAVSGSTADQASTAMYQLSQALASGTVKLMDWNSVVNAGMGGAVFQDALKETARLHGVGIDQMIKDEGSFRNTLEKGWLTSDILTETLAKFTGDLNEDQLRTMGYSEEQIVSIIKLGQVANDAATKVKTFTQLFSTLKEAAQSGWAKTWQIIIGDFGEAKETLTRINDVIGGMLGASADARNNLLQAWKDLGGRDTLIASVKNAFEAVLAIVKPVKEALREIFPPITAQQLFNLTVGLKNLTERFKIGEKGANNLKRIFKGLFAFLDIGVMAISALGKALFGLTGNLGPTIGGFSDLLARVGDFIVKLRDGLKGTDGFTVAIMAVGKAIAPVIDFIKGLFSSLSGGVESLKDIKLGGISTFFDDLKIRFEPLRKIFETAGKFIALIGLVLTKIGPTFLKLGSVIAEGAGKYIDKIMLALDNFDPEKVFAIINGGLFAGVLLAVRKFINKGSDAFSGIKGVLDGVKGSLMAWQTSLKADTLLKIAAALGLLTLSIIALSMIDSKKLKMALTAMTIMFAQLGTSLLGFQKISSTINPVQMGTMAVGLVSISLAMLIMAGALSKLGKMNSKELMKGFMALILLIPVLTLVSGQLANSSPKMIVGAAALIVLSFAIRSLASAVKKLGELDTKTLTKGLIGVGVLVTELALFLKATDLSGIGVLKSVGILILAGAILLLTTAVSKLADMDDDSIAKGLLAMAAIFAELSAFIAFTGGAPGLIAVAAGVGILAISMLIMANALGTMGTMSWEEIGKSLVAMAGALTIIGAAAYLIPPTLIITAAGLVVMAAGLVILAEAMSSFGGMSWDEIAKGLVVLAGSLLILTLALSAMSGTLMGSAALLVAATALAILAPALKIMGSMSLEEIGLGLLALAGTFVVLGVAGAVLTPVIPTLLGLAVAMVLIGVGAAGIGVGVLAFSAGLAALSAAGAAGAAALVLIITSIVSLIPMIVRQLGKALLTLVEVLVEGAPVLLEGVVTLLNILLDGLVEIIPKIIDVVITLVDNLLRALDDKMPTFVQAGYDILISFLEGVKANIGDVVELAYDIVIAFLDAVSKKLPELADSGANLIISWIDAMSASIEENTPRLMESVRGLGLAIVKGVLTGLIEGRKDAKEAMKELGKILLDAFKDYLGIHSASTVFIALALDIIKGLILGFKNNVGLVISEIVNLGIKIVEALKSKYSNMVDAGKDLVIGFGQGIKNYISTAVKSAGELAAAVLNKIKQTLGIASPAKELIEVGMDADRGLAGGITKFATLILKATKDLGGRTVSAFSDIVSSISNAVNSDMEFSPTIRPVIDLTDIRKGESQIDSIFGTKRLNLTLAANRLSNVVASPSETDSSNKLQQTDKTPAVSFTQNNYSPSALSRIEIYRQTRNQLTLAKEMVGVK